MIITTDKEEAFEKIQRSLMTKALKTIGINDYFLNNIKIYSSQSQYLI